MGKKRGKSVNVSGKPKHSLDANRTKGGRTAATVRRLKMYNRRPKRDRKGNVLKHDFQSKEMPSTQIQPDFRWFGNTRVVSQKELELLRDELQNHLSIFLQRCRSGDPCGQGTSQSKPYLSCKNDILES